ncbi:hypothetical protein EPUS_02531 [Endocarpon pusillum Z07020]|uniref:Uncharacterized protein n=1 Tax=Endocarpon pusillum (strain Z07020 / HMAS-L-300199) TaxID=1263415 RepID=U1HKC1_ENDPU|nr:uncharacterized protein EPUS_02531 [Endocarpon pusillum Z07020]ERF70665.1 hypothetical protein EPUS_02531 [Endocarpon pusillum Z07020]
MLFPGHERSRLLLEDSANSGTRLKVQECATVDKDNTATESLKFDLLSDFKQIEAPTKPSVEEQNHDPKIATAQAKTKLDDQWPNGIPPTGPRKSLKWAGQYTPRRPSTTVERVQKRVVDDGTALKGTVPRPLLSQTFEKGIHSLATTKSVDKAVCGTSTALESLQRTKSSMHDSGHVTTLAGYETVKTISQNTTKLESIEQNDGQCDKQLQINVEVSEYSPPEFVALLSPTNVPSMPSSDPQTFLGNGIGHATKSPTYSVNKTHAPYTNSPSGVQHKDTAITEDNWVCRRCLNKLAKKAEPQLPSICQLPITTQSESIGGTHGVPAAAHIPVSLHDSRLPEESSIADAYSQSAIRFGDSHIMQKESAHKPHAGDDRRVRGHGTIGDAPTAAPHSRAPSDLNTMLMTENTINLTLVTAKKPDDISPANLPSYSRGWEARTYGKATKADSVNGSRDFAPSSPAAAPSVLHRATHTTTGPPLSPNETPPSMEILRGDTSILPPSADLLQGHSRDCRPPRPLDPEETQAASQLLADDAVTAPWGRTKSSSCDNKFSRNASELPNGDRSVSKHQARKAEGLVSIGELNIPETPSDVMATAQSADHCAAKREKISRLSTSPPREASQGKSSNIVRPFKKLCSLCQRPILGSTSLCTKCKQTTDDEMPCRPNESLGNGSLEVVDLPTMTMTGLTTKKTQVACGNMIGQWKLAKESRSQEDVTGALRMCYESPVPGSPVIPETPDLGSEKTSNSRDLLRTEHGRTEPNQIRATIPIVPQKRRNIAPLASDSDHCFSKKRPRFFKPTTKSIAVTVPLVKSNQPPLTPKSGSPHVELISRDASVQASVETAHRGTSPCSASFPGPNKNDGQPKCSALPDVGRDKAISEDGNISIFNGTPREATCRSPCSSRMTEQWQSVKENVVRLEHQAKEFTERNQAFEQAKMAIDRLQRPDQAKGQLPTQKSSVPGAELCKLEDDGKVVNNHSTSMNDSVTGNAGKWTLKDEKALLEKLKHRGVIFEDDSSSDSEVGIPPPTTKSAPRDPLWRRPRSSSDLFMIAPDLNGNHNSTDPTRRRREIAARPFRKERRLNISYLRQERGDNIHEEIDRICPSRMVKVSSTLASTFPDPMEKSEQRTQAEMTFSEFIGVPASPMALLTKDKQLAFRDGTRDAKGSLPRAREKFIVTNRNIFCMEK